jgi:thiol-disulfide isomerase/thioredoxin
MRIVKSAVLYTALVLVANVAIAGSALEELREGDMMKLAVHAEPMAVSALPFVGPEGDVTLADFEGKVLLVNFWATWCAPCREEMPSIAALGEAFAPEDFVVITIATGRNPAPAIEKFLGEVGLEEMPVYTDLKQQLAREMGVMGLPVTILIDREGQEVARLTGGADWNSESARAIIAAMIGAKG